MIKFSFVIDTFPDDLSWDYALRAGVSGKMEIEIDGNRVFFEEEFLVAELFMEFHDWINSNKSSDADASNFYFVSMDEEEEPLIAFKLNDETGLYDFESVWAEGSGSADFKSLSKAHDEFMVDLREQLLSKYNYFLKL